jgi:Tol biopolymer transport system component
VDDTIHFTTVNKLQWRAVSRIAEGRSVQQYSYAQYLNPSSWAQIFAPGVVSGPANDGSPAFSPDGNTIFFTRSTAAWGVIVESHNVDGHWTQPTLAAFSGEWPDSSSSMSPDGS